jgi:hypothetical protein
MTVNYLGKVWEVNNFQDFAQQVRKHFGAYSNYPTGWANGLTDEEYKAKKLIADAMELKALADFWKSVY